MKKDDDEISSNILLDFPISISHIIQKQCHTAPINTATSPIIIKPIMLKIKSKY